jgi:hypothetical protein
LSTAALSCVRQEPNKSTQLESSSLRRLRGSVSECEFVAEDVEAGEAILAFFIVAFTLAALLAAGDFAFGGDGAGELDAKIEVAANAFPVGTIETKNGFGVVKIGFVFHAAIARNAFRVKVLEVDGE